MHFTPRIGKNCGNFLHKLKFIILGDSHYEDENRNATERYLNDHIDQGGYKFWTSIESIMFRKSLNRDERSVFWDSLLFANMAQRAMKVRDEAPKKSDWAHARKAMSELFREFRPHLIFMFSARGWAELPDQKEFPGTKKHPRLVAPNKRPAYLYSLSKNHVALAGCFNHPTRPYYSFLEWHNWSNSLQQEVNR